MRVDSTGLTPSDQSIAAFHATNDLPTQPLDGVHAQALMRDQKYELSEAAGYRMQTVIQIAPKGLSVTAFGEQHESAQHPERAAWQPA